MTVGYKGQHVTMRLIKNTHITSLRVVFQIWKSLEATEASIGPEYSLDELDLGDTTHHQQVS